MTEHIVTPKSKLISYDYSEHNKLIDDCIEDVKYSNRVSRI